MLTFYEGLPRSGKSYSSMKDEIIPALQAGRHVYAFLDGLDLEKIAEVAELPLDKVQELLHPILRENVKTLYLNIIKDSLIVLDEAQNFWPSERKKLDQPLSDWIAEHGHDGIDVILMGQVVGDVHSTWRGRIERKHYFLKKTALGKPDSYSMTIATKVPRGDKVVFENVQTIGYDYDPKYFGTYKSHTDGTKNKSTKVDQRAVIWNKPIFKKYLPLFLVFACFAIYYLYDLFHGGFQTKVAKGQPVAEVKTVTSTSSIPSTSLHADSGVAVKPGVIDGLLPDSPKDMIQEFTEKYRIRLIGTWRLQGLAQNGMIEWRDSAGSLIEALSFRDIEGLGYTVFTNVSGTLAILQKSSSRFVATSWPIDKKEARPTDRQQQSVSGDHSNGRVFEQVRPSASTRPSDVL